MNLVLKPPANKLRAWLHSPLAWVAVALVLAVLTAATLVGRELYASTSLPMVLNSR